MLTITNKTHDRILEKLDQFEHTLETLSGVLETTTDESERASLLAEVEKTQAKLEGAKELFYILNGMA